MTLDTRAASLADLQPGADRRRATAAAELPREVVDILRLRGITGGPVLLLAECPLNSRGYDVAPQFQLTRGAINEAPALAGRAGFVAVVVILDGSRATELEPTLAAIASQLAPGTALVAHPAFVRGSTRAQSADARQSTHLSLLRSGYDRVWVHSHRKRLCISAKRAVAERAIRTCSIMVPVFNEKDTFPELDADAACEAPGSPGPRARDHPHREQLHRRNARAGCGLCRPRPGSKSSGRTVRAARVTPCVPAWPWRPATSC